MKNLFKQSKMNEIKKSTIELIETSSIQGFPNLFRTKRSFLKMMWILSLVLSTSACVYYETKTILDFFDYEVVTSIKTVNEPYLDFPTISICSQYNKSFKFEIIYFFFNFYDWKNEWKKHFENYSDYSLGQCYRFNSGKDFYGNSTEIKRSTISDRVNSLILALYVDTESDLNGLFIYFHNHTFRPKSLFGKENYLSMGFFYTFKIDKIVDEKLEYPYNDCIKDISTFKMNTTLIKYFIENQIKYSQSECNRYCQSLHYNETNKCGCYLDTYEDIVFIKCYNSFRNTITGNCTEKYLQDFNENNPNEICKQYCPLECDTTSLNILTSSNVYPSHGKIADTISLKSFPKFNTFENVSKKYIQLNAFFNEIKYTYLSQQPKVKIFDLISNIGGLFGLFLGMGLLSFIELLEIVLEATFILFKN